MKFVRVRACLLALAALACQNDAERAAEHAKKGNELLAEKKWDDAVIEFKNATKLAPNDAAAHYGLAKAYLGRKEPRNAYWELEETVRLNPNDVQARIDHGEFLLFGRGEELEKAVASGDAIIAADPKRWEGYALKGRALTALGRHEEAGEAFEAGVKIAPDQPPVVLLWANHLKQAGKLEEAEAAYKRLAELAPGFGTAAALGGFYASSPGRDADAEAAYRKALEAAKPEELVFATTVLANFLASRERGAEAEGVLKAAIEQKPDSVDLIYALAAFYAQQGRKDEADRMIEQATSAQPEKAEPWLVLSAHRGKAGDLDAALKAAEQAVKLAPDNDLAKLRRAEVLVDIGARKNDSAVLAQAEAAVNAILGKTEDHPEANFVRGKLELARRNYPAALQALRRTIDRRPDMAQAYFLSGSAKFLTGDRAGARADAQEALARQPNFVEAVELLARSYAALGDHALAVEAGKRALAQGAGPGIHIAIAQSLVQLGQRKDALAELAKIPEGLRSVDAEYAVGRVHLIEALQLGSEARGEGGAVVKPELEARANAELATARTHLARAAELAPNNAEVLASLVTVDLRQGQAAQSLERVRAASKAAPKDAGIARLQGDVELAVGQLDAAQRSYERAIEIDPNQLESYGKLAGLYNRQGRASQVISTYEAALEKNPKSGELHLVLGILKEAQGGRGIDDAIIHYKKAIELNPDLAAAKNNLAFWLAERGEELDYALDLAQEAKAVLAKNPRTNPSSADTLGWVFYKKNLPEAAVNYLREAVGGFDPSIPQDRQTRPLVRHHLALALAALGDNAEAASEWKLALAEYSELPKGKDHPEPDWVKEARDGLAKATS
ncbi:MAG TPA: tetratricopeptide repeat protein [Myxococcota bacterium]|nr:tetratricopeptide repeat protein [Myxococcota bacterium]